MKGRVRVASGFRWPGTGTSDTLLRTKIMFRSVNGRKCLKNLRSCKINKRVLRQAANMCKFGHIFLEISYVPFRYIDLFYTYFLWSRQTIAI
jgi:hypothetical protein